MLCRVGDLPGDRNLQIHMRGRKHKHKLATTPDAAKYSKPLDLVEMGKWIYSEGIDQRDEISRIYLAKVDESACDNKELVQVSSTLDNG